ncbi:hypothetical protein [Bacillus sp. FSL W8-0183]|uniref:hypothetical protein n=1 Tax=Bacillus sp. FSL W8-0183 TaxID=2954568 RepID=UPI0030F71B48
MKYEVDAERSDQGVVALSMSAWIEITVLLHFNSWSSVALYMSAWIEISIGKTGLPKRIVALSMSA